MKALLRVLPLALGLPLAGAEELPAIFVPAGPRSKPVAERAPGGATEHLLSERLRAVIAERAAAVPLPAAAVAPPPSSQAIEGNRPAVVMEQVLVTAPPPFRVKPPPPEPLVQRFIRTGTLYHKVGPNVDTEVYLHLLPIQSSPFVRPGATTQEAFTRVELAVRLKF